jgi:Ca2+-binding EF-hand superfamily protein
MQRIDPFSKGGYGQSGNASHKDYSNTRVLNMVRDSGLNLLDLDELVEMKNERSSLFKLNNKKLFQENQRKWLKNKDKEQFIDFNDEYRRKMKIYFNSLDTDGGGSIGIEELEEPLITLGIATDRDGVKALMDTIDKDKSRQIEFSEFLQILKGKNNIFGKGEDNSTSNAKIVEFFKGNSVPIHQK